MGMELTDGNSGYILKSITLLYVEDDKEINKQLSLFLRRRVNMLFSAFDGQEGLELFKIQSPDVVVTDIRMPNMDGIQMAKHIKEIRRNAKIIVTTAFNDEEYFIQAIDAQIDSFLKKPVDPRKLVETITRLAIVAIQEKELYEKSKLINFTLNSLPNFILTTRNGKVEFANSTLLSFLNCGSIRELHSKYKSLDDILFINTRYCDISGGCADLMSYIKEHGEDEIIVSMNTGADNCSPRAYILKYAHLPESETYVFSLTDVEIYENKRKELEVITITDELTGLYNKRYFNETLSLHVNNRQRYEYPISLVFFDIDHFKTVNDTYGHLLGDCVLKELSKLVSEQTRGQDVLARWGGEEFVLLMPHIDLDGAVRIAQRLRLDIEGQNMCDINITSSFGVVTYMCGETERDFLNRADALLYEAKNSGRNKVCF
ncbi:response regulator receiver modulated diguanylate cyclase [Candidatus Magnetobacterium bavaricum]|uniref:diguanylate cyclase n=1 Tax=Candidatus Magnetobacterium bavaricum TaxID=29290 RepID=A0A0F3GTV0_9BACT|nr:response regulator receiver modulated diguanylate cyclase [Candidatus Magnetobacterium bavaricum]